MFVRAQIWQLLHHSAAAPELRQWNKMLQGVMILVLLLLV
jgi:hypothetical protein